MCEDVFSGFVNKWTNPTTVQKNIWTATLHVLLYLLTKTNQVPTFGGRWFVWIQTWQRKEKSYLDE